MAKIDVRKDYYGDLGIAPSANTEEIKKQFRKLGVFAQFQKIYSLIC